MLSLLQLDRTHVYGEPKKRSGERSKVGRVSGVLFHPDEPRVVGYLVERSDLALMIERKDRMLALDRANYSEGRLEVDGAKAWDRGAAKRLGVDWDKTVVWLGMPVHTRSGRRLGLVRDGVYDPATGQLNAVGLTAGLTADVAVGVRDLPARMVVGFDGEGVIVADEAAEVEVDGGAAAAAGKATAVAADAAGRAAAVAADTAGRAAAAAGDATGRAAVAAGEAAAKATVYARGAAKAAARTEAGKKTMGWLKALKAEVVDAMGPPDDED